MTKTMLGSPIYMAP